MKQAKIDVHRSYDGTRPAKRRETQDNIFAKMVQEWKEHKRGKFL